jgi:hypothetical protein
MPISIAADRVKEYAGVYVSIPVLVPIGAHVSQPNRNLKYVTAVFPYRVVKLKAAAAFCAVPGSPFYRTHVTALFPVRLTE